MGSFRWNLSSSCRWISAGTSGFSKIVIGIRRITQKDRVMTRNSVISMAPMRSRMYLNIGFS